jgi:osmotically-inducible protein OsmY
MKQHTMNKNASIACIMAAALSLSAGGFASDVKANPAPTSKSSTVDESADNTAIANKVKAQLAGDKEIGAMNIAVDADGHGTVRLTGHANSEQEAKKAVMIARTVHGVAAVRNNIKVVRQR